MDPLIPDAAKVAALRDALPATAAGIYLDTAAGGPLPAETLAAMREADDWEVRVGRATAGREEDVDQRASEARAVLAALVTAQPREMALAPGLEAALAAAIWSADLRPGDRVVTTSLDGRAVQAAVSGLRSRLDVEIDVVGLGPDAGADEMAAVVTAAARPRTRLIVTSVVSPVTGARMPVDAIAARAREAGAWFVLDASAAVAATPLDVPALGGDFVCFAADRWALGPEGTAALWAGPRALAEGRPGLPGAGAFETLTADGVAVAWRDGRRFEPGTLARSTLVGLARSVGWLAMYVGLEWAFERTARLARRLRGALAETDGVAVLTPDEPAAIVTFRIGGWGAEQAADELGRRVFAILRPLPELEALRVSVAAFNTEDELVRFADAVGELAGHTPESLPRRPALVILPPGEPADGR